MKKKGMLLLTALAVLLTAGSGVKSAWSYFTTYAEAKGGYPIRLEKEIEFREDFSDWTKRVTVTSQEDSVPVYVRAKAFAGSQYVLEYEDPEGRWTYNEADGYWYYGPILNGGESTSELRIRIGNIPAEPLPGDNFNVVVICESTRVLYDEAGNPYADWNRMLNTKEEVYTDPADVEGSSDPADDAEGGADQ